MLITAWGVEKELADFLNDTRVHPLITRDVVVKRLKGKWLPEISLTKGVADELKSSDTKVRREARAKKMEHRIRMFLLAQEVRRKYNSGVEVPDLQQRYQLSKSQVEKFVSKNEYYNIYWEGTNYPAEYKEIVEKIKKEKRYGDDTN